MSATINGPLMEALADATGYSDKSCIGSFREGAPILGSLPSAGRGLKRPREGRSSGAPTIGVDELSASMADANGLLLSRRREDDNSAALLEKTKHDADLGRMSSPMPLRFVCFVIVFSLRTRNFVFDVCRHVPTNCLLAARFGVEQGLTDTNTKKIRPVDDMSASGVNACCSLEEKLSNDGVDTLFQVARKFYEVVGEVPDMFKADIDSAYRRIPLAAADR